MFDIMGMIYGVLNTIFDPILAMDPNLYCRHFLFY